MFIIGPARSNAESQLPKTLLARYFVVHYNSPDSYPARLIARTAEDELLRISQDLGYTPDKNTPFPLNLYAAHYDFIKAGGLESNKFTVGTARSGDQSISVDTSGVFISTQQVLAHEITHAVIFRIVGANIGALPLWLNEGLAKYESDDFNRSDRSMVAEAASNGTLMQLADLEQKFPDNNESLAYAESTSAAQYFVQITGKSGPRRYLAELARTGSADKAMQAAASMSEDDFIRKWTKHVSGKYALLRVITIISSFVSVFMALLVIAAFMMRRKQKKAAAQQWEEEEFDNWLRRELGNWHR